MRPATSIRHLATTAGVATAATLRVSAFFAVLVFMGVARYQGFREDFKRRTKLDERGMETVEKVIIAVAAAAIAITAAAAITAFVDTEIKKLGKT